MQDQCEQDGNGLSDCLFEYAKKSINSTCTWREHADFECNFNDYQLIQSIVFQSLIKGYDWIYNATGCMTNCKKDLVTIQEDVDVPINAAPFTIIPRLNQSSGVLILTKDQTPTIPLLKQVESYTIWDFISESGGIMGIYIGFSFWGVVEDFAEKQFIRYIK